ncbi:MAG: fasciclin domain-containing protein [Prevotellaceae bacterium]|nr:fasciclin domain-containing protein [Prevotellaceae bacterium]MDY6100109.1 fasciclin domain-containing protein [Bacteroidaceae bacterium]
MKRKSFYILVAGLLSLGACTEEIDKSNRYVFTDQTAVTYMQKHASVYSEYLDMLFRVHLSRYTETTVGQLLSARGHYTIFAPTNSAVHAYLETLVDEGLINEPTWESFTDSVKKDSIRNVIVLNSILDSGDDDQALPTAKFPLRSGEELSIANMNDRKLTVYYGNNSQSMDSIYINGDCPVHLKNRDIPVLNGYIHQMEKVIDPKRITMADYLADVLYKQKEGYLVMAKAIQACGLMDTLRAVRDEAYEKLYQTGVVHNLVGMTSQGFAEGQVAYVPEHRKYGFTLFAEHDDYWKSQGIDPSDPQLLEKLQEWVLKNRQYSDDDDYETNDKYTSPQNLLHQWVTYHLLPMKIPADKLVIHENEYGYDQSNPSVLGCAVYDLYTTMGKRRLLKVFESAESGGIYLNRFPVLDNGRHGNYHELSCDEDKAGVRIGTDDARAVLSDIVNGYIYPIYAPLAYTDDVRNNLHRQRLRFDIMAQQPEAMSNDIRKAHRTEEKYQHVYFPNSPLYSYFDNIWIADGSHFVYYNAYTVYYPNLNSDEIKAVGYYDLTFTLPPVPRYGTYEIRWGYDANVRRGMCQIFVGNKKDHLYAADIPLDLRKTVWVGDTGFEPDTGFDEYDAEVDKRMRNRGYMKGGNAWTEYGHGLYTGRKCSAWQSPMRRIIYRGPLDPNETYYLRAKSVLDSDKTEFMMDILEICPKEVYDNPENPEDIW